MSRLVLLYLKWSTFHIHISTESERVLQRKWVKAVRYGWVLWFSIT